MTKQQLVGKLARLRAELEVARSSKGDSSHVDRLLSELSLTRRSVEFADAARPDWTGKRASLLGTDRVLMSETHRWLRRIPGTDQPKQLCRHYPRVANAIARSWDDPILGDLMLVDLMVDRRGGRRGFPPRILEELHVLRALRQRNNANKGQLATRAWRILRRSLSGIALGGIRTRARTA